MTLVRGKWCLTPRKGVISTGEAGPTHPIGHLAACGICGDDAGRIPEVLPRGKLAFRTPQFVDAARMGENIEDAAIQGSRRGATPPLLHSTPTLVNVFVKNRPDHTPADIAHDRLEFRGFFGNEEQLREDDVAAERDVFAEYSESERLHLCAGGDEINRRSAEQTTHEVDVEV